MPNIRPLSDLRNSFADISSYVHETQQPVFLTKNGRGDMAVMSIEAYERLTAKFELAEALDEGLADIESGKVIPIKEAFSSIRASLADEQE